MKKIAYLLLTISFCGLTACKTGTKKGGNMDNETLVKIETTLGDIKVKLYNETPKHRDNFIKLAEEGVYEGTLFHRVIKDFMIQAGDPDSKNAPKGKMLKEIYKMRKENDENGLYELQEKLFAQAQEEAAKQPEFHFTPEQVEAYTTVGGTPHLDGEYTVFGEVVEGMDIVDKIQQVKTDRSDRPEEDVKIVKVEVLD